MLTLEAACTVGRGRTVQIALALFCLAVYVLMALGVFRVSVSLPLSALGFLTAIVFFDERNGPKVPRIEIVLALSAALVLAWLIFAMKRDAASFYRAGFDSTGLFCSAWLFTLSLPWFSRPMIRRRYVFLALAVCFFASTFAYLAVGREGRTVKVGETLYRYQAQHSLPPYGAVVPAGLETAFPVRFSYIRDGILRTQYPPGWPVVIRAAESAGLVQFLAPGLACLCLALIYFTFAPLWGAAPAIGGAVLLACSPFFAYLSTTLYAHLLMMVLAAASVVLRIRLMSLWLDAKSCALYAIALGFLCGAAVTVRPLAGLCLVGALAIWTLTDLFRAKLLVPVSIITLGVWGSVGAALPLAFLLHYNYVTTGNPLHLGYTAANGPLHNLGFGRRGMVIYSPDGTPIELAADFQLHDAMQNFLETLSWAGQKFVPMSFPLFAALLSIRTVPKARFYLLLLGLLPCFHFFYPFAGPRFWSDLLPFVAFGAAAIIVTLHRRWRPIIFSLGVTGAILAVHLLSGHQAAYSRYAAPYFQMVEEERKPGAPLLVLVKESDPMQPILNALFVYNSRGFSGDVVVTRYTGAPLPALSENRRVVIIEGPPAPERAAFSLFNPN